MYRDDEPPDQHDEPEACVCGASNADDEGRWVCLSAPGFCSVACAEQHAAEQTAEAEAYAAALAEEDRVARAWHQLDAGSAP